MMGLGMAGMVAVSTFMHPFWVGRNITVVSDVVVDVMHMWNRADG